jgi:hypothetical protein
MVEYKNLRLIKIKIDVMIKVEEKNTIHRFLLLFSLFFSTFCLY